MRQPLFAHEFVEEVIAEAEAGWETQRAREAARKRAMLFLRAAERAHGLSFDLPIAYRPPLPDPPTRRLGWAAQAHAVFDLAEEVEARLMQRGHSGEALAELVVLSAILNGALLRPEGWVALWATLARGRVEIKRSPLLGNTVWIDLRIGTKEELRFYPDVVTLSLLARWTPCALPLCHTVPQLLRQIKCSPQPLKSDTLSEAGFAVLEDGAGADIPQVLFSVANGTVNAAPVPANHWEACLRGEVIERASVGQGRKPAISHQVHQSAEQSEASLKAALRVKRKGAMKMTRKPVERALTNLLADGPTPIVRARTFWFLALLGQRRKVSSLWRYNSALADVMLLAFEEADPARMSAGEIEIRLNAVLEAPRSLRDKTLGARLHQFFDFAATDPRLYWPELALELPRVGRKSRPRTAVISGAQISRLLGASKGPNAAAVLMGARGGLRLSDMEALLIRDVEHGPNGVLRIHPTKEGDIKTAAGRRQAPLPMLLTSSEFSAWQSMTAARRQDTLRHDAQFLGQGGGLDEMHRFDRNDFARELSETLGQTPHDLRHGALSNLALALLAPEGAKPVRTFTGWSAARIEAIRNEFSKRDTLGGMHQIARLAGHREAKTTFETYLHLSDLALGLHIAAIQDKRSAQDAARLLGLNARSFKSKREVTLESLRPRVLAKLQITEIKATKAAALKPHVESHELSIDLVLRLCTGLHEEKSAFELAQIYALPMRVLNALAKFPAPPAAPRRKSDRVWLKQQIEAILMEDEPQALIALIRSMPQHAICFHAPLPAKRWLNGFGRNMRTKMQLQLADQRHAANWAEFDALLMTGRSSRLVLFIETPVGTNAVPLLHHASDIAARVLAARSAIG
ncbi:hypothetical protein [Celeribacter sp.]|uniref:hypothetical protein n=1 Tax=Celeribacter sp. TaxID=1890673 RepID=UPI003A942DEE